MLYPQNKRCIAKLGGVESARLPCKWVISLYIACSAGKASWYSVCSLFLWCGLVGERYLRFNLLSENTTCSLMTVSGDCYLRSWTGGVPFRSIQQISHYTIQSFLGILGISADILNRIFRNIFPWFLPRRTSEPYRYWTSNFWDKKRHHFSHSDCAWTEEFDFLYFGTPWNLHPKEPSFRVRLCKPFGLHFQEPFLGYISSLLQTSG